ncbi:MAG: hypothetical protein ACK5NT_02950 [Pyrinomonadaceae bacterium]
MKFRYNVHIISITIAVLLFTVLAEAQNTFPYELYEPRTFEEFDEIHLVETEPDYGSATPLMISANPFYSAIRVEYTAKSRKLSDDKLNLFKIWVGMLNLNSKVLERLESEYLFKECDREFWIPVQKQVAAYFPKELKEGDMVTLYVMAVGGLKPKNDWEYVFLTNEFRKY